MLLTSIRGLTPMYHTSFFMIFWAGHNVDTLVHDFSNFAWFCMTIFIILHDFDKCILYHVIIKTIDWTIRFPKKGLWFRQNRPKNNTVRSTNLLFRLFLDYRLHVKNDNVNVPSKRGLDLWHLRDPRPLAHLETFALLNLWDLSQDTVAWRC